MTRINNSHQSNKMQNTKNLAKSILFIGEFAYWERRSQFCLLEVIEVEFSVSAKP